MIQKLLLPLLLLASANLPAQPGLDFAPNQLLLIFAESSLPPLDPHLSDPYFGIPALDSLNAASGIRHARHLSPQPPRQKETGNYWARTFLLTFELDQDIPNLLRAYQATGLFETVEPNYAGHAAGNTLFPNDAFFFRQWGLFNDGSFSLQQALPDADIDMEAAWDLTTGSPDVVLAVLDNGVNYQHPEFTNRIWVNTDEQGGANGVDDDNNGYVDDLIGYDFAYLDNDPDDAYGHGTNVAGIAAATGNNGIGYAGVDWQCKLMPLKILDDNDFGLYNWWISAIYYATDEGADVINLSVAGNNFSASLENAINYAHQNGVVVVAAMGNQNNSSIQYPAGHANAIAVGSTNPNDWRSSPFFWNNNSGSNFGNHIDVVAPGNYMYGLHYNNNNFYNSYWGGTSQAAPLVAGLAALMRSLDPSLPPDEIRQIIRDTAEDQVGNPQEDTPGFDPYYGYGRINAFEALLAVTGVSTTEKATPLPIHVAPNPLPAGASEWTISLPGNMDGPVRAQINNGIGQVVWGAELQLWQGSATLQVPLPPGFYVLTLETEKGKASHKLWVQ